MEKTFLKFLNRDLGGVVEWESLSDIFLSYASEDRARVVPLVRALESRGWSVWWDRTIPPGQTWEDVIEAAIKQARCVVVLWSRASVESAWVKKEARTGARRRILVPALIDAVEIPWAFEEYQAANLVGWTGSTAQGEYEVFVRAIGDVLGPVEPVPQPPRIKPRPVIPSGPWLRRWQLQAGGLVLGLGLMGGLVWEFYPSGKPTPTTPDQPVVTGPIAAGTTRTNSKDGLTYVWIPPGRFMMGCSPGDKECHDDEKPPREVAIEKGFWLGQTEVTQAAWKRVIRGKPPSRFEGDKRPVEQVSMEEAKKYCAAVGGRLPTEEEWEYAARAGSTTARHGDLDKIAWYDRNSDGETHEVKQREPNAWGLYDMLGNVWEWVEGNQNLRGGSWFNLPELVRASCRRRTDPGNGNHLLGVRCVGELPL